MSFVGVGQILCMSFFPFGNESGKWDVIVLIPDHCHSIYFADDTSLYIIVDNPTTAADCPNMDLNKISRWAATW